MSKEYKIWNGLIINNSTIITGITDDSGLTNLSTVLPTSNAVKSYVDNKISIESSVLHSNIDSVEVTITGIISTETSNRISVDQSLSSIISTEISIRTSIDFSLTNSISLETSQRTSVDQSLSSIISTEISTRTSVDQSLSTEISILDYYFDTLNSSLSTEISIRTSVDSSISTVLNNKLDISGGTLLGNLTGTTLGLTSQLYLSGITNDATPNDVLYYNPTTKKITFGIKPNGGSTIPGGNDTNVQYNDNGIFNGSPYVRIINESLHLPFSDAGWTGAVFYDVGDDDGFNVCHQNNQLRFNYVTGITNQIYSDRIMELNQYGDITLYGKIFANLNSSLQSNILYYNTITKEITYGTSTGGSGVSLTGMTTTGNTFLGINAGINTIETDEYVGVYNVFLGNDAAYSNIGGSNNVFIGYKSGYNNISSSEHVFIGNQAGYSNTTSWNNVFIGFNSGSGNTTGSDNTFLGYWSGEYNISGYSNTFIGSICGRKNTYGINNTFLGVGTGGNNTIGNNNTFIGRSSGIGCVSGSSNIFIGFDSGYYENGSNKLLIDNQNRGSLLNSRNNSLIYGQFDSSLSSQFLQINGKFYVSGLTTSIKTNKVYYDSTTKELSYYSDNFTGLTDGSIVTWDCNTGLNKTLSTSGNNFTLNITNVSNGMKGNLIISNPSTPAYRTINVPSGYWMPTIYSNAMFSITMTNNNIIEYYSGSNVNYGLSIKWEYVVDTFIYKIELVESTFAV